MEHGLPEKVLSSLRAFERAWLDPLEEPIGAEMSRTGWTPDTAEEYCDRCGSNVGPNEVVEFGCSSCVNTRPAWDRFVRLGEYEPPLKDWVHLLKFERHRPVAKRLGRMLGESLRRSGALAGKAPKRVCVVPVPMPAARFVARGIDHTRAISLAVGSELGVAVVSGLSAGHHRSQRSVPASSRRANVRGKYGVRARRLRGFDRVILLDDVLTTGATLTEASRSLKKGLPGVEIWAGAVSVVG